VDQATWLLTGPFLYVALVAMLAGATAKILRFLRMPRHLRWELYPIPRLGPAGSKYQLMDFAGRPSPGASRLAEIRFMLAEILLLRTVFEQRRQLWLGSFLLHAGLYLSAAFLGLLVIEAVATGADTQTSATVLTVATGGAAVVAGLAGTLLLLWRRWRDPGLRAISDAVSYFNLLLLAALFGSAAAAWLTSDPGFAQCRAHCASLLRGQPAAVGSAALVLPIVLLEVFLIYLPFSRMFHAAAKYFFYHQIRWEEESLRPGTALEQAFAANLGYRSTWSASHVQPAGSPAQEAAKPAERAAP
jgi:nitrate reductase gamma subunit